MAWSAWLSVERPAIIARSARDVPQLVDRLQAGHEIGAQQRLEIVEEQRVPSGQAIVERRAHRLGKPLRPGQPVPIVGRRRHARQQAACATRPTAAGMRSASSAA